MYHGCIYEMRKYECEIYTAGDTESTAKL